jgi:carbamoyltransferase
MLVLGISGGVNLVYEDQFPVSKGFFHDSAAALVDDGKIVAAIEEERLNRIKHTNKAPTSAVRFCLSTYGIDLHEVDRIAFYGTEQYFNNFLKQSYLFNLESDFIDARTLVRRIFTKEFGYGVGDEKLVFVHHHLAHAVSAYALSGFNKSLILTIDGQGDGIAGMLLDADGKKLSRILSIPTSKSLGIFYNNVINFIGYGEFEEYKVMGLAPYGDPGKYRNLFKSLYTLLPNGDYLLHNDRLAVLYDVALPRKKKDPITQVHQDIAAALQESLEDIVFHILRHYRQKTGHTNLCLAGGVAHNCTLNGKILYSGIFSEVFVQPASHDAGTAIGAALYTQFQNDSNYQFSRLKQVYLGTDLGDDDFISETLADWGAFVEFEKVDNISKHAAGLIANGAIIGWVQGRSEFGPRALGNRSILADPRPAENKDIINEMVKKREAFRPFAPSVLEECASDYFDLPHDNAKFPFMIFVVKVRKEKQSLLGAVTHVDGTARIHTVSSETNGRFWELIHEFGKLTDVYVLLNTSFNNNVEPIIDSAEDAITCFLTTKLHYLVLGEYLVSRKRYDDMAYLKLIPSMPLHTRLQQMRRYVSSSEMELIFEIGNSYDRQRKITISSQMFDLLSAADGQTPLDDLIESHSGGGDKKAIVDEILKLWSERVVKLRPRPQRIRC